MIPAGNKNSNPAAKRLFRGSERNAIAAVMAITTSRTTEQVETLHPRLNRLLYERPWIS